MNDVEGPFDLSLAVEIGRKRAWYIEGMQRRPVRLGDWVGSLNEGGAVNFLTLEFNPHAHGSHTETLGHVCRGHFPVNQIDIPWMQEALIVTVRSQIDPDMGQCIRWAQLEEAIETAGGLQGATALLVRAFSEVAGVPEMDHSNTDAPYFEPLVGSKLAEGGILHWMVDLPSVDREEDGGALACHRAFWNVPLGLSEAQPDSRVDATISELLHIPATVADGRWHLQMNVASIENDAAPCRPMVFRKFI
ncbi:MAG: cyclase family protein [Schleiferiaceae bacterium]|nr:cyclase family protein [Schleiferiaceae bacterium]